MMENKLRDNRENVSKKSGLSSSAFNGYSNNKEYNSTPSNRFYTEKEEVTLRFYQTPKALFKNPKYKGLPLGPKLIYSILRDRLNMSIKNNWKDEKGYIYLIFSIEELARLLEIDRKAIMRYKKLLVDHRLIIDKRLGQGRSNKIYVLKPELSNGQKSQNTTSRSSKRGPLEVTKCNPINTEDNETNLNNVNRAGKEKIMGNSKGRIKEIVVENEEDINDIRRIIKESLKENRKYNFTELKESEKENRPLKNYINPKGKYSKNTKIEECPAPRKYRSREKEQLAIEITEELNNNHSLGAFRIIVDKISEQKIRIFLSIVKDAHLAGKIKKSRGAMFISLARAYAGKNNINLNFR
jgi:hypothetical protein